MSQKDHTLLTNTIPHSTTSEDMATTSIVGNLYQGADGEGPLLCDYPDISDDETSETLSEDSAPQLNSNGENTKKKKRKALDKGKGKQVDNREASDQGYASSSASASGNNPEHSKSENELHEEETERAKAISFKGYRSENNRTSHDADASSSWDNGPQEITNLYKERQVRETDKVSWSIPQSRRELNTNERETGESEDYFSEFGSSSSWAGAVLAADDMVLAQDSNDTTHPEQVSDEYPEQANQYLEGVNQQYPEQVSQYPIRWPTPEPDIWGNPVDPADEKTPPENAGPDSDFLQNILDIASRILKEWQRRGGENSRKYKY